MKHPSARRKVRTVRPRTALWINYQMLAAGVSQTAVAKRAGVQQPLVSRTLSGTRNSTRVQAAVAELLGYQSWGALLAHARRAA